GWTLTDVQSRTHDPEVEGSNRPPQLRNKALLLAPVDFGRMPAKFDGHHPQSASICRLPASDMRVPFRQGPITCVNHNGTRADQRKVQASTENHLIDSDECRRTS